MKPSDDAIQLRIIDHPSNSNVHVGMVVRDNEDKAVVLCTELSIVRGGIDPYHVQRIIEKYGPARRRGMCTKSMMCC